MTVQFGNWLDERIGWRNVWDAIFLRKIPKVNWFYTLGSATLFVAVLQGSYWYPADNLLRSHS